MECANLLFMWEIMCICLRAYERYVYRERVQMHLPCSGFSFECTVSGMNTFVLVGAVVLDLLL